MDHHPTGPIQILVFALDEPYLDGSILDQVAALEDEGTVRLLDAAVLVRESEAEVTVYSVEDAGFENRPFFGQLAGPLLGLGEPEDQEENEEDDSEFREVGGSPEAHGHDLFAFSEDIAVGGTAGVLVLEQIWASGLLQAIEQSGGQLIADDLIHAEELFE